MTACVLVVVGFWLFGLICGAALFYRLIAEPEADVDPHGDPEP